MWLVVAFRLLCPVSVSTALSVFQMLQLPSANMATNEYIPANIHDSQTGEVVNDSMPVSQKNPNEPTGKPVLTAKDLKESYSRKIITIIWISGMMGITLYGAISILRLRKRLIGTWCIRENIYLSDYIDSPFVMGIWMPKIYLPSSLGEREKEYIILHEQIHIKRGDHIFRLLAFLCLTIHWFNPLVWIAFYLSAVDMEMSCDEAVMKKSSADIRAVYSGSLLQLATGKRFAIGTPLAFGEGNTKGRIKNIMGYKRTMTITAVCAVILVLFLVVILGSNPKDKAESKERPEQETVEEEVVEEAAVEEEAVEEAAAEVVKDAESEKASSYEELSVKWAQAFCARDGETIISLSTEKLQREFNPELMQNGEEGVSFGWSSPWPFGAENSYEVIDANENQAQILYYALTSDPHVTVWSETISYQEEDGKWLVYQENIKYFDAIDTQEKYLSAYPNGITDTPMDYAKNGLGEALNANALSGSEIYRDFLEPDTAAASLLNLDVGKVRMDMRSHVVDGSCLVSIQFEGSENVNQILMIQPYGEDGIWIPQNFQWSNDLTSGESGTYTEIAVRSISKSMKALESYVGPDDIVTEPVVFAENCVYKVNTSMNNISYKEVSFDEFAAYINEADHWQNKICNITLLDGEITEIELLSAYYSYGISYDRYTSAKASLEEYEWNKQIAGENFLEEFYTPVYAEEVDIADVEGMETIQVYTGNIGDGDSGYVLVKSESEKLLFSEFCHVARAGWGNIYLGEMDGVPYLLSLHWEDRGTFGISGYYAYRFGEDGELKQLAGSRYEWEEEGSLLYDENLVSRWVGELIPYLQNSVLLLSTQDGEIRTDRVSEAEKYSFENLRQ